MKMYDVQIYNAKTDAVEWITDIYVDTFVRAFEETKRLIKGARCMNYVEYKVENGAWVESDRS